LWERIRQRARQLREAGLREGQPYVFTTTQDADFIVTYCAVHLCGAVSVPLESSTTKEHQQQILDGLNGQDTLTSFNRNEMVNGQRSTVNGQWSMVNKKNRQFVWYSAQLVVISQSEKSKSTIWKSMTL
jgi:acyl-CoA synthetase (AMP-forming)/AMP-acid ligase II